MGVLAIRMPDIGEGIAEAEIAEWLVKPGDVLREDDAMIAVMTDKATVEIPSPVTGTVIWQAGQAGDVIAVGAELIRLEVDGPGNVEGDGTGDAPGAAMEPAAKHGASAEPPEATVQPEPTPELPGPAARTVLTSAAPLRAEGEKPVASPSVRARAREAGVDLRLLRGSGPAGRISHEDLDAFIASGGIPAPSALRPDTSTEEIRVIGLRRKIAERMEAANSVPHITIVEEVDATAVEELRARMNASTQQTKLTLLPFLVRAIVRTVREQPMLNAHYEADAGLIRRFGAVHIGIATQTPSGLMVPVLRHAETLELRAAAGE
uniref:dihydrolipoamide acetyltransferase family protein n=1 Tax=uncultured Paracoccus sp. TaxID=189685 RepID=UPI0026340973